MKKTKRTALIILAGAFIGILIGIAIIGPKNLILPKLAGIGQQSPSESVPSDTDEIPTSVKDAIFIDDEKDEIPADAIEAAKEADDAARKALLDQNTNKIQEAQEEMKAEEEEKKAAEEAKNLTKEAAKEAEEEDVKDQSPSESTPESTPNSGEIQGDPIPTPEVEAGEADNYTEQDYVPGTPDPGFVDPYAGDPNVISGTLDFGNPSEHINQGLENYTPQQDMTGWGF